MKSTSSTQLLHINRAPLGSASDRKPPAARISCPDCGKQVVTGDLARHLNRNCPGKA